MSRHAQPLRAAASSQSIGNSAASLAASCGLSTSHASSRKASPLAVELYPPTADAAGDGAAVAADGEPLLALPGFRAAAAATLRPSEQPTRHDRAADDDDNDTSLCSSPATPPIAGAPRVDVEDDGMILPLPRMEPLAMMPPQRRRTLAGRGASPMATYSSMDDQNADDDDDDYVDSMDVALPPPRHSPVKITTTVWRCRRLTKEQALERVREARERRDQLLRRARELQQSQQPTAPEHRR
eukprot:CAMPEP_0174834366 /NCGR_PEP_ID=MMETSP1114-20130205/4784_1 /TAXON_ID=312471 /ORGANISM="Neobodo designis, Strain CCAP 1951/1" /LENGTH=240 /DNA_ID=CAMNT_0016068273 /DNA_START=289 /DNA_END=1011 /DNA_ORIENTATION=+